MQSRSFFQVLQIWREILLRLKKLSRSLGPKSFPKRKVLHWNWCKKWSHLQKRKRCLLFHCSPSLGLLLRNFQLQIFFQSLAVLICWIHSQEFKKLWKRKLLNSRRPLREYLLLVAGRFAFLRAQFLKVWFLFRCPQGKAGRGCCCPRPRVSCHFQPIPQHGACQLRAWISDHQPLLCSERLCRAWTGRLESQLRGLHAFHCPSCRGLRSEELRKWNFLNRKWVWPAGTQAPPPGWGRKTALSLGFRLQASRDYWGPWQRRVLPLW